MVEGLFGLRARWRVVVAVCAAGMAARRARHAGGGEQHPLFVFACVQRVVVGEAGAQISLNLEGLASLVRDLSQPREIAA